MMMMMNFFCLCILLLLFIACCNNWFAAEFFFVLYSHIYPPDLQDSDGGTIAYIGQRLLRPAFGETVILLSDLFSIF